MNAGHTKGRGGEEWMNLRKVMSYIDLLNPRWIKNMYTKHKIDDCTSHS